MKEFPKDIEFKYSWRDYQQRVLDELETHLSDDHLHVIAPPGSGKTILGLEVALRLNKPTLIFAPTIAIRNQWIKRFTELFLQSNEIPSWISRDIKNPQFLTVSTYQGLYAACSAKKEEIEQIALEEEVHEGQDITHSKFSSEQARKVITLLQERGVRTIIVDEAHHLKNAWWRSLDEIKRHLSPTIVGLTATPPYDVNFTEWKRYLDLNGPVDAEISVPELVVEGDLCPHQDYVLFSRPTIEEHAKLEEYANQIDLLFESIKSDSVLKEVISELRIFTHPKEELEWIYTNLEQYSSCIIFLNSLGVTISPVHLEVIGDTKIKIPDLDFEWMEILLKFYLYSNADFMEGNEAHKEYLLKTLKRNGALERKSISFRKNEKRRKLLSSSLSKLESIRKIVEFESSELEDSLRLVILTDYIRKEYLVNGTSNFLPINKIGVLPIFEKLRREQSRDKQIGVLTGSIVILPTSIIPNFIQVCSRHGLDNVSTTLLSYDASYTLIRNSENLKHEIVHIITHLFESGYIRILIGTKSLLGEGWDAPAINSLILASFVGSYVLSNQMRGRAIRRLNSDENKTGNIWHLVCADLGETKGGADIDLMKRRFRAFVGVSYSLEPSIESGIDRLDIPNEFNSLEGIEAFNERIFEIAQNRDGLRNAWTQALEQGNILIEEIKVPFQKGDFQKAKSMTLNRTIGYLFGILGSGLLAFGESSIEVLGRNARYIRTFEEFLLWIGLLGLIGLGIFGRLIYKSLRLFFKYRDISKDLENIGIALLNTLCELDQISTDRRKLEVKASQNAYGSVYCHLEGGSTFEKSLFIQCLAEVIGQIDNPRYLIVRKSKLFNWKKQKDYHSVPESIGRLKTMAQKFERNWRNYVGSCDLIFTRNIEGRKILLRSRLNSLATEIEEKIERVNKWK
ncbi:MAG: DEAD/DEAH box helicase family protein [Bacteroidota bacterium]